MNERQEELVKGLMIANEFLKVLRSFKLEEQRNNPLPSEVSEALANAHLNHVMQENNLEPEHLVFGLVHVLEMFLKITDTEPEDLSGAIEHFIRFIKEQENQ